ncbi:MAG TPA: ABC transporter ATP-binding protein [Burkholderiales bacterium]|nr:ABC transporter ATP-binding protein [Burkholderiales bacterium]
MTDFLLETRNLRKSFGALLATDQVDFDVREGETHAVIGPNGAGKTTFIKQISGELRPDAGNIRFAGEDVSDLPWHKRSRKGLARSFQITSVYRDFTALDNVALAIQAQSGHSFRFWRSAREDRLLTEPAVRILEKIGLEKRKNTLAANLSHGEQRQLEIAMVLATHPRLMLLDEPVAGMGTDESQRMIEFLATLKGKATMVLVEHDMDAVFTLADRISVLVYGRIIATGTPADIRANAEVRAAYLGEDL